MHEGPQLKLDVGMVMLAAGMVTSSFHQSAGPAMTPENGVDEERAWFLFALGQGEPLWTPLAAALASKEIATTRSARKDIRRVVQMGK